MIHCHALWRKIFTKSITDRYFPCLFQSYIFEAHIISHFLLPAGKLYLISTLFIFLLLSNKFIPEIHFSFIFFLSPLRLYTYNPPLLCFDLFVPIIILSFLFLGEIHIQISSLQSYLPRV